MFRKSLSAISIVIATITTLYFVLLSRAPENYSTGPFPMVWSISIPDHDTAFGGLFSDPTINDSLPYYAYKKIQDSIEQIKKAIKVNNGSSFFSGRTLGAVSVAEIQEQRPFGWKREMDNDARLKELQDSMNLLHCQMTELSGRSLQQKQKLSGEVMWRINVRSNEVIQQRGKAEQKHVYLGLTGYTTKDPNTQFFINNGSYNLAYVVWDSVRKRTFDSTKEGHYEHKPIAVRYSAEQQKILVPITEKQHRYLTLAMEWGFYLFIFLGIYFFIGIPLQIVLNIAKGKAFTLKNIQRFKLMAYTLFSYWLLVSTAPYVLRFLYRDRIGEDFVLTPFTSTLLGNFTLFLAAVALYLVGKAFQRGYTLQQDHALTI